MRLSNARRSPSSERARTRLGNDALRSATALLKELATRGIRVRADGERLVVDAPKGALDESLGNEIRATKTELLEILDEISVETNEAEPPITDRGSEADGLVSAFQERIWLLDRIRPESGENNLPGAWRLRGLLNETALEAAIIDFEARHPIFQTRFRQRGTQLRAEAQENIPLQLERIDFSQTEAARRELEFQDWLQQISRIPFRLGDEPALRLYLARLGPMEHALYAVSHSIAWDGWCFDILLEELGSLYEAHCRNEEFTPPAPSLRYQDFVYWQRSVENGPRTQSDLNYWKKTLSGALDRLPIPTDRPLSGKANHAGARSNFSLPENLVRRLTTLSIQEGVTVYMLLLAAWSALLGRMVGTNDIVMTTPVRGRDQEEVENIIGPFTNTLFLRISWDHELTFRQLIEQVKEVSLGALEHQNCPVDDLLQALPMDLRSTSLFQFNFSYQNTESRLTHWGDLEVEQIPQDFHAVHAELNLWVRDAGDSLSGAIDYRTGLFDPDRVQGMIQWFLLLLDRASCAPDQPISSHSLLDENDREHISNWSHGYSLRKSEKNLLTKALGIPSDIVIESERGGIESEVLRNRSMSIAYALRAAGIQEGDAVAVRFKRSVDAVVGLVGVLRAGACWMPVPSSIPTRSLSAWVRDKGACAILHDAEHAPENCSLPSWNVDDFSGDEAFDELTPPRYSATSRICDLSGLPSASHQSIAHDSLSLILESRGAVQKRKRGDLCLILLGPDDPAFAPAVISALASEASLAIPAEACVDNELDLKTCIQNWRPQSVEANLRHMYALLDAAKALSKSMLWIYGDLSQPIRWQWPHGNESIWRVGGSASTGEWGLLFPTTEATNERQSVGGLPAPGFHARILDDNGLEIPPGLFGQLTLARSGDALPFNTAWQAFWNSNGTMEVIGRQDDLIHAQGSWVKLDTMEEAICSLPFVDEVHLEARITPFGDRRLIAWVVYRDQREATSTTLRNALANQISEAPRLGIIVPIDKLPRDHEGRIRSESLPDPMKANIEPFEAPQSEMEKILARIWTDILALDRVSVHDNFSELGGNSLQALRVLHEIEHRTGWSFSPRLLFFQTLRQIAARANSKAGRS